MKNVGNVEEMYSFEDSFLIWNQTLTFSFLFSIAESETEKPSRKEKEEEDNGIDVNVSLFNIFEIQF